MDTVDTNAGLPVCRIARQLFDRLALQFPVCMASDEFHFFPQARSETPDWSRWDDFSPEAIQAVTRQMAAWDLDLAACDNPGFPLEERIDIGLLRRVIQTLCEQLTEIAAHQTQPSFYLTILGVGLAEAIDAGSEAMHARMTGLPAFLDGARRNLRRIPGLFRELGHEMIDRLTPWLLSLDFPSSVVGPVVDSLERLRGHLNRIPTTDTFLLPGELYKRVAARHMGCLMPLDEIALQLDGEILETRSILERSASQLEPGTPWPRVVSAFCSPDLPPGGAIQLYQSVISDLADHCLSTGLASPDLIRRCPVRVKPIPDYLLPVRSGAAFSMPPGYPPAGGTFYLAGSGQHFVVPPDYRLLCAHETYPGHHLLDTRRWGLERWIRRHVEFPIFYEGWASFSEELLFDTGFFAGARDRMLIAKRRFWRAVRGRVDLDIHSGKRSLADAAFFLVDQGMDVQKAAAMVWRYALKPGYQLAYTIGRRRFRSLYEKSRENGQSPVAFAQHVLSGGEIGFDDLKNTLLQGGVL